MLAFNMRSGAAEGRPSPEYVVPRTGLISFKTRR